MLPQLWHPSAYRFFWVIVLRLEWENYLPQPAGHASLYADQNTIGLMGCKKIAGSCPIFHPQLSQVLSAACSQSIHPPVCTDIGGCLGPGAGSCTWLCWTSWGSHWLIFNPVKDSLDGIPSNKWISCTTQLSVSCRLPEGAFNPTVYVTDGGIKLYWSR